MSLSLAGRAIALWNRPAFALMGRRAPASWTKSPSLARAEVKSRRVDQLTLRRNSRAARGKAIVETDRARTEGCDLKQATRHHDVLEEVDHLVLVGEVAVERHTRDHRKYRQRECDRPNLVACD